MIDLPAGKIPQGVGKYGKYVFPTELRSPFGSSFDISLKNCGEMKTDKTGDAELGETNSRTPGRHGEKNMFEVRKYIFDAKSPVPSTSKTRKLLSSS